MSKYDGYEKFSGEIDSDRIWRIKEISDLKTIAHRSKDSSGTSISRATVVICYAHWEGHVKFSALKFFDFVAQRRLTLKNLSKHFTKIYFMPKIGAKTANNMSVKEKLKFIEEILDPSDIKFSKYDKSIVNTRSNLDFSTFSDICLICDVNAEKFESNRLFIDNILLGRRNKIAHGENIPISPGDIDSLAEMTIGLMREFGNSLQNVIAESNYKKK
jgi:hypothetical protein